VVERARRLLRRRRRVVRVHDPLTREAVDEGAARRGYLSIVLDPAEIAPDKPRPSSRADYERMVALSMFEGERVELLHGTVVQIGPHGPLHDETVDALDDRLARQLGGRAKVRVQSSFAA